jgi:arylsulfatase A-like enzyme
MAKSGKPNILILWGDDIGWWNISYNNRGQMGYRTPNIDRIGNEGATFTDYYGQQSCTAGRAAFITGQNPIRTGLTKVGMPGADVGLRAADPTIADLLKPLGYATGQFGKNHLGDKDEFLPTVHGFDEFFGNLYHLNAEEEPEDPDYPKDPEFKKRFGPRGVLHSWADGKGGQRIEDTGPLTKKRMETIDEEVTEHALGFIDRCHKDGKPFFLWYNTSAMHFRTHRAESTRARAARETTTMSWWPMTRTSAGCWPSSTSWASPTTRSSCTRPTTAPTTTAGRMARSPRSAAKKTPIGRAAGGFRSSCAGRARSNRVWC